MRLFADGAATLAADSIGLPKNIQEQQPPASASPILEHSHLDRATHLRSDQVALDRMEHSVDARFVILHKKSTECLFQSSNSHLALLSKSELPTNVNIESRSFLGLDPKTRAPLFSVDLRDDDSGPTGSINLPLGMAFGNIRTHAPLMPSYYDYELVLYATPLSNWKRTHKFCSICASPLVPIQEGGGTCLQCTSPTCGNLSWPRQDPTSIVIVLVTNRDGDKALLAHSPRRPPKVHTALAGFVEAGETFEQAVIREVMEETGTRVKYDYIQYVSSQPWPFPRSCMIGFVAHAMDDTTPLVIDRNELVSAGWFDREQVRAASKIPGAVMNHDIAVTALEENPSLDLLIPPRGVLARSLIDHWLENPVEI
jgi:NAD+ diphosphatase